MPHTWIDGPAGTGVAQVDAAAIGKGLELRGMHTVESCWVASDGVNRTTAACGSTTHTFWLAQRDRKCFRARLRS